MFYELCSVLPELMLHKLNFQTVARPRKTFQHLTVTHIYIRTRGYALQTAYPNPGRNSASPT